MIWGFDLHQPYNQTIKNQARDLFTSCVEYFALVLFFVVLSISCLQAANASSNGEMLNDSSEKLVEYLSQQKTRLIQAQKAVGVLIEPSSEKNLSEVISRNDAQIVFITVEISTLQNFLANELRQEARLNSHLAELQKLPPDKQGSIDVERNIEDVKTLLQVNEQTVLLINDNLSLANHYKLLLFDTRQQLGNWQEKQLGERQLKAFADLRQKANQQRERLYQENIQLQQQPDFTETEQAKVLINNQEIEFINNQITVLQLQTNLLKAQKIFLDRQNLKTIQSSVDIYKDTLEQIKSIDLALQFLGNQLIKSRSYVANGDDRKRISSLKNEIGAYIKKLNMEYERIGTALNRKQQELKKQLSVRQSLTGYRFNSWAIVRSDLSRFSLHVQALYERIKQNVTEHYTSASSWSKRFFWGSIVFIALLSFVLNRLLRRLTKDKERSMLTGHLYEGALVILARNIPQLAIMITILFALTMSQLSASSYDLIVSLILVWLVFRNLILLARLTLLERVSDASGEDVRLFHRLRWLLLFGGWTTALMVFSQHIPFAILLQVTSVRLFMVFILALSLVFWVSKDVIPFLFRPVLKSKKRYIRNAVSWFFTLLPITLFTTGVVGLLGYINLAWTMGQYQAYVVLVVVGYILIRGLISDALHLCSEWMISSLKNGWLWIEVFLKPLDKLIQLLLVISSCVILLQLYGLYSNAMVVEHVKQVMQYPFIDQPIIRISMLSILEFLILLSVFVWAVKWTREFCYRWLYRRAKDSGVRNSLAVFTQYGVILIGGYVVFKVLGFDFAGMSIVLGGLAVGMGFGLRDFASNIIGGIMLLIERPVREGDLITLGEHEGRVAHIGIRSMRVSSWDNTEVLIPNAETFNKPFTNWTHQDNVVRTVVPIKINRVDDPIVVQNIIFDVLSRFPEIVNNPEPQVFLKQIDEALIEFEVRYFINVFEQSRFEVRSKVLLALTARFKSDGIKAPIPPMRIELNKSSDAS